MVNLWWINCYLKLFVIQDFSSSLCRKRIKLSNSLDLRSSPTFRWAWYGFKLFAKAIPRRINPPLACIKLKTSREKCSWYAAKHFEKSWVEFGLAYCITTWYRSYGIKSEKVAISTYHWHRGNKSKTKIWPASIKQDDMDNAHCVDPDQLLLSLKWHLVRVCTVC